MKKTSKVFTTVFIIFICISVVLAIKFMTASSLSGSGFGVLARVKGNENAPVKITEFIDLECPACAYGAKYLKTFMEKHPHLVRLEMKYFPLKGHRHSLTAARYTECVAKQGKFWPYIDLLLGRQKNWKKLHDARPAFDVIAKEMELNVKKLDKCLEDKEVDENIQKDKNEGIALKIKSTPTYFVNGKMMVGSRLLKEELDKYLKEKKN